MSSPIAGNVPDDGAAWTDGDQAWDDENEVWGDGEEGWVDGDLESGTDADGATGTSGPG